MQRVRKGGGEKEWWQNGGEESRLAQGEKRSRREEEAFARHLTVFSIHSISVMDRESGAEANGGVRGKTARRGGEKSMNIRSRFTVTVAGQTL